MSEALKVVITGASRGIGRSIALAYAERGAHLALCGIDVIALEETARLAMARGAASTLAHRCDVSRHDDVKAFADHVHEVLGGVDVVVHNAGVVERARIDETTEAAWDHVVDVNLKGPYLLTHALLPRMRERRRGRLVFIASISGTLGTPRLSAYCASKHGVIGFMRAAAEELRNESIYAYAVNPGSVDTDMLKGSGFPPQVTAEEIANVVVWLGTDAPGTMTGSTIDVFG